MFFFWKKNDTKKKDARSKYSLEKNDNKFT